MQRQERQWVLGHRLVRSCRVRGRRLRAWNLLLHHRRGNRLHRLGEGRIYFVRAEMDLRRVATGLFRLLYCSSFAPNDSALAATAAGVSGGATGCGFFKTSTSATAEVARVATLMILSTFQCIHMHLVLAPILAGWEGSIRLRKYRHERPKSWKLPVQLLGK